MPIEQGFWRAQAMNSCRLRAGTLSDTAITSGPDGYWTKFDWAVAATNGMKLAGLPYSGQYDFTTTHMYWPINHMVAPAAQALTCTECHAPAGRLDWQALGYDRDPAGGIRRED